MRIILLIVALLAASAAAASPPDALRVTHVAPGWASVALDAPAGYEASIRVVDLAGPVFGMGIYRFDASGTYQGGIVYAGDELDSYAAGNGFDIEGRWDGEHAVMTLRLRCDGCVGEQKLLFWFAGTALSWEHAVQAAQAPTLGASLEGERVFALHQEDFGATMDPTGAGLGYAIVDGRTPIDVERGLYGAFPSWTMFWDDDHLGASSREITLLGPDGVERPCAGSCLYTQTAGAGVYEARVTAVGAGLAYLPVLFTGADAQLP